MIGSFKSEVFVADKNELIWNELNLTQAVKCEIFHQSVNITAL